MKVFLAITSCLLIGAFGKLNDRGVKLPTACEVCNSALVDSYGLPNKKIPYAESYVFYVTLKFFSEMRLTEIMEDPDLCTRMLQYRVHKERKDSTRFQKSRPQTFETLQKLIEQGVDVKVDIPPALWDNPSVEITVLRQQCEKLVYDYERWIEEWFYDRHGEASLSDFLCRKHVLNDMPAGTLSVNVPISKHK
ncbi:unnamed protein product [Mesocestoides corti]|uniref:DUF3456 domain-containing protein n=1 Tax=Mesocestoides corti TaxID=53468 RepID=A0A0R3U371_MESCO|nr:unnamed protein product [Mesocestoides corti]